MTHPEQIIALLRAATDIEARPADAAALLIDAAALIGIEAQVDFAELHRRLDASGQTLRAGRDAVAAMGIAAGRVQ